MEQHPLPPVEWHPGSISHLMRPAFLSGLDPLLFLIKPASYKSREFMLILPLNFFSDRSRPHPIPSVKAVALYRRGLNPWPHAHLLRDFTGAIDAICSS